MNANVVCEVSLSVPLLSCAQQVLPVVQLRWLRVTDLASESGSLVPAHLYLNLFLALRILGVQIMIICLDQSSPVFKELSLNC